MNLIEKLPQRKEWKKYLEEMLHSKDSFLAEWYPEKTEYVNTQMKEFLYGLEFYHAKKYVGDVDIFGLLKYDNEHHWMQIHYESEAINVVLLKHKDKIRLVEGFDPFEEDELLSNANKTDFMSFFQIDGDEEEKEAFREIIWDFSSELRQISYDMRKVIKTIKKDEKNEELNKFQSVYNQKPLTLTVDNKGQLWGTYDDGVKVKVSVEK